MKTISALFALAALVVCAGCSTVESRVARHRASFDTWPPPVQQQVAAGQINIGFSPEMVRVALGDPDYVYARTTQTGSSEVWSYRDRGPRFSFGIGMGSFHGGSGFSSGVGVSTGNRYPDEKIRVIFDQTGRVSSIEQVTRG